jgi:hypothetical protein
MTLLTDDEIDSLFLKCGGSWGVDLRGPGHNTFAREVEAAILAKPVAWIPDWSYEQLMGGASERHPVMMWPDPKDKTGLVPLYAMPSRSKE